MLKNKRKKNDYSKKFSIEHRDTYSFEQTYGHGNEREVGVSTYEDNERDLILSR